jgi:hypothetical protein
MIVTRHIILIGMSIVIFISLFNTQNSAYQIDTNVLLAEVYQHSIDVRQYLLSEICWGTCRDG